MAKGIKEAKKWAVRLSKERVSLAEALRSLECAWTFQEKQEGQCGCNSTPFQGGQSK